MNKDDLLKLAQDPRFIAGIYNYCDRWCDRCPLTARCLNYALELEQFGQAGERELPRGHFWKEVESTLKETAELIATLAKEQGIDLSQLEVSPPEPRRRARAKPNPLATAAKAYRDMADEWFEKKTEAVQDKGTELLQQLKLGVSEPERDAALIYDAVEVIRWYQPLIEAKIGRAMHQKAPRPEFARERQSDADGSVKIALIAIDRSLAAWTELRRHFPEHTDDLLPLLVHLDRLRRDLEQAFPGARQFVRPGFDAS